MNENLKKIYGDRIYPASVSETAGGTVFMVYEKDADFLVTDDLSLGFEGRKVSDGVERLECPLSARNAKVLRAHFPYTAPIKVLKEKMTMGVGDRLGNAAFGHIKAFNAHPGFAPVFAQQSVRELNLTGRTYSDIMDAVSFAVYREGYKTGFGADGDHLKTEPEIANALDCGCTMITLDCSEYIRTDVNDDTVDALYTTDTELEGIYLGKSFSLGEGITITFDEKEYKKAVAIYTAAIGFASHVYYTFIRPEDEEVADFEMSIDETSTPTTPAQHFFIANELRRRGIIPATVAPRFCGEFQKGVDYIGDIAQFEAELKIHAAIARHFGYKLSIHSGSDKFSAFPYIGRETRGNFHIKTAGTNWLQSMLLIAKLEPSLYREVHEFALEHFHEAAAYYHVTTDLTKIPALDTLSDDELPGLFSANDPRQLIHITYGLILNAKNEDGTLRFRDRLYKVWRENETALNEIVGSHIEKHMETLLSAIGG